LAAIPIHRLGFGALRITGRGIWSPPELEALRTLKHVPELGIDFIDTLNSPLSVQQKTQRGTQGTTMTQKSRMMRVGVALRGQMSGADGTITQPIMAPGGRDVRWNDASGTTDKIRVGHQPQDRQNARPDHSAVDPRYRRRGHRIARPLLQLLTAAFGT